MQCQCGGCIACTRRPGSTPVGELTCTLAATQPPEAPRLCDHCWTNSFGNWNRIR
jgi:hypothetical protein